MIIDHRGIFTYPLVLQPHQNKTFFPYRVLK
jgi:hypothetical protein